MKPLVKECCKIYQEGCCRLTSEVEGWGCRLLVCLPDQLPRTEADRKKLFHKVYTYAQECGVLACPHYREEVIDEVIQDRKRLSEMVRLGNKTRTDLLSEDFWNKYN